MVRRARAWGAAFVAAAAMGGAGFAGSCGGDFAGITTSSEGGGPVDGTADAPGQDAGADSVNPPGCPPTQPQGACSGEKMLCTYGCTSCGCSQGTWVCQAPGCAGGCNPSAPAPGSSCGGCCGPSVGMSCDYACPGDAGTFRATCKGSGLNGTWTVGACAVGGSNPGQVTCGTTDCDLDAGKACCDTIENDAGKQVCGSLAAGSFCAGGAAEECDEKADCVGNNVCCIQFLPQGISATCMPTCITGAVRYQACKTTAECENGGPCATHACPAGQTVQTCEKPLLCQ